MKLTFGFRKRFVTAASQSFADWGIIKRFHYPFQWALRKALFRRERYQIYRKSSCPSEESWSTERRPVLHRPTKCKCNRGKDPWARDHCHAFLVLSSFAHQASLPGASYEWSTSPCPAHALRCNVLDTRRTFLSSLYTTKSCSGPWFH